MTSASARRRCPHRDGGKSNLGQVQRALLTAVTSARTGGWLQSQKGECLQRVWCDSGGSGLCPHGPEGEARLFNKFEELCFIQVIIIIKGASRWRPGQPEWHLRLPARRGPGKILQSLKTRSCIQVSGPALRLQAVQGLVLIFLSY